MPKRPYINATKKSKPLFTQQQVISVQDIHFYYSTHTHGSYILSTHRFQSRKIGFLVPLLGATRADFFVVVVLFLWKVPSFSMSHKVIELGLQGRSHLVRLWAAAAFFLVGVFRRLVSRFLRHLLLLVIVLLLLVFLGFIVLTFVSPTEITKDYLEREV